MLTSDELRRRLQRLAGDLPTEPEDALVRVVRTARRRRVRNRTGGVLALALLLTAVAVTPTVLEADRSGQPVGTAGTLPGPGSIGTPGVPGGYVYEPTWLPEHVRRIAASEESAGPLVAPGQWSQRILASETRCPPSCSVLSVRVLRGQPPLDAARQARDYAGGLVTVRGREGVLLPAIAGMRDFAALIWTAPSRLLVVVEGTDAGTPVPERKVLADKEADLDPTASTPAPFPRALRHQFSATTPTAAAPSLPVIRLDVRRGLTGDELRERAAVDRCARRTRVRGHTGWLLGGTSLVEAPAPTPTGQPCSLDREIGLVWTEHDDVTIQVVVDASLDAVDPNGVDLLRRFAEHLRGR